MSGTCKHHKYGTRLTARGAAKALGLDPRKTVELCNVCGKWKVVV